MEPYSPTYWKEVQSTSRALGLREVSSLDVKQSDDYDRAFATYRSRGAHIAAGRVRLAPAIEPRVGLALAVPAQVLRLRLAEAALAFGVMTLAVVGSFGTEPSRATAPPTSHTTPPSLSRAARVAPAAAAPQPEDPQRIRAARLKYSEVGDVVFRVTAGSPY